MGYGLSVVNVVDSPNTTIAQVGTPVAMDAAYPLSNIATRQVSKFAKTADDQVNFNISLTNTDTGFGVNPIVAIIGLSDGFQSLNNFTIKGSNISLAGEELFSESVSPGRPGTNADLTRDEFIFSAFIRITSAISPKYLRIYMSSEGGSPISIGRVWAGPSVVSTERSDSLVGGLYLGGSNASSAGGQAYGATAKSLRQCQVSIEKLLDTEKQEIMRALSYVGRGRPFVYMRITDGNEPIYVRDNSFYCHLEGEVNFTTQAARDLNTVTFGFIEER